MVVNKARLAKRSMLLIALVAVLVLSMFAATALAVTPQNAKNVIVMIADGCGYNTFLAGNYYQYGEAGKQVYDQFPTKYAVSTYAFGGAYNPAKFWSAFENQLGTATHEVTESNMAATAMGTGMKTNIGVGVNPELDWYTNIVEIAEGRGRMTGVVSTQSFAEATPAGFSAHANDRKALKTIIEQQLRKSKLDVIMGPQNPWYNNNGELQTNPFFSDTSKYLWTEATWNDLKDGKLGNDADADGEIEYWTLIESREDFQAMMTGDTPERVAGVAQCGGEDKVGSGYTQFYRTGAADDVPFKIPFLETSPTLTEMSLAAINVLDQDPDGFFLMIEGANVDYGCHFGWMGRAIEELVDFNYAVEAVVEWVEANSSWDDTLLVVTTDHETGGFWGPGAGQGEVDEPGDPDVWVPIVNNGKGNLPGAVAYNHFWAYGPDFYWHTNALVPLYAQGVNADLFHTQVKGMDPVRGAYIDNTGIFNVAEMSIR